MALIITPIIFTLLMFLTSHVYAIATKRDEWTIGQAVETTSGTIKGHAAITPGEPEVSEYLGIPFAESTAGKNRFMAPVRFKGHGTVDAANYGLGCPAIRGATAKHSSEDCLFANVWTMPQVGEKAKAVLVWIYGGGFSGGDSSDLGENGAKLAKQQDVVVVSFNYRTNIFGFPGEPHLPNMNPGLMDQRMAVEWVRDNIARFGGDVNRIVLFGESAGASSVDYFAYDYLEDPIVAGFIAGSGAAHITGPFTPPPEALRREAWYNTSSALGCGGEEIGFETVICAQSKTVKEIQSAMPSLSGFPRFMETVGWFGPYRDNRLFFDNYHALAKDGRFIRRPMLIGSNHNESTGFVLLGGSKLGSAEDVALNNGFRCGVAEAAKARAMHSVPVWRYHYAANYFNSNLGAFHGQELYSIFNGGAGLAGTVQKAWATFAKDPENGLSKLGWPRYDASGMTLVRLGWNEGVGRNAVEAPDFVAAKKYDGQCPPSPI